MTHLVLPSHANTIGVTFGGQIMAWMESCAIISAMRHCRKMCLTVAVDTLHFLHPIQVGEAVIITARVNAVFSMSIEVEVSVSSENLMVIFSSPSHQVQFLDWRNQRMQHCIFYTFSSRRRSSNRHFTSVTRN
jgi:acyl-coenzyme A thioesterase PaaI-like protein